MGMNLLACEQCARQYDVTHLEIGALIRCACDKVSAVPARRPLAVTALACTSCGGTVRPDDEACPYCEAALDQAALQSTTVCPKCYTRIPDDARHCNGCGIEIHPQALTPIPDGKACPRCKSALQIRSLEISDVIECCACQGIWVRSEIFHAICRDAVVNGKAPLPDWPKRKGTTVEGGSYYIPCLGCEGLMQRRQFKHNERSTGVVVDICRAHGIWLDHRELERITQHIRENGGAVTPIFAKPKLAPQKMQLSNNLPRDLQRTPFEKTLDFILETFLS